MAMAEPREWQQHQDDARAVAARLRVAEEQRVQAEGRCFSAERRRLDAERRLTQVEALLDEARLAGERTRKLVLELVAVAAQLRAALEGPLAPTVDACPNEAAAAERAEMADALAAAVERLRARWPIDDPANRRSAEVKEVEDEPPPTRHEYVSPVVEASQARPPHKHSSSAIARWRNKRKQRQQG